MTDDNVHQKADTDGKIEKTITISVPAAGQKVSQPRSSRAADQEFKKSLTSTFLTGVFTLFDKTEDVDLAVTHVEPAKTTDVETAVVDVQNLVPLEQSFNKDSVFASGGQGVLCVGNDLALKRQVALKSLRPEHCSNPVQRNIFLTEARVTAQLEHPSIVPIYSLHSEEGNGLTVAMKKIRGRTLQAYLDKVSELYTKNGIRRYDERKGIRTRIEILLQICDALEYAHSRNVMHCDLKPVNIMIGEYHEAYLMDWGIAHPILNEEYDPKTWVKRNRVSGTPRFLAPETLRGEYSDQRADIYAMGLILYEIVTLQEAVTGKDAMEIMQRSMNHDLNPLVHKFGFSVSSDLEAIIRKACAFDPKDRYQTIKAFSEDLRRYLSEDEVSAHPDNLFRKIYRFCIIRHGKATIITALLCLLTAVGASAVSLKEVLLEERIDTMRKTIIVQSFVGGLDVAYSFDHELSQIEENLENCTNALLYQWLNQNKVTVSAQQKEDVLFNVAEYSVKPPKTFLHYPAFSNNLDYGHVGYLLPDGTNRQQFDRHFNAVNNLYGFLRKMTLQSAFGTRLMHAGQQELENNLITNGVPVSLIYFAFANGPYFCYPGKVYRQDYDPCKRRWYIDRINPQNPSAGWSTPYLNASETGFVVTYSIRMTSPGGQILGVSAVDLDISGLFREMNKNVSVSAGCVENTLVDTAGNVIVTNNVDLSRKVAEAYLHSKDGGATGYKYPNPQLLYKMRHNATGYFEIKEHGKTYIYVFSRCRSINLFYFEKLDLGKCMQLEMERRINAGRW